MNQIDPAIVATAKTYGHNLKPLIDEITLREQLPQYGENKRLHDNARRTLDRRLKKMNLG